MRMPNIEKYENTSKERIVTEHYTQPFKLPKYPSITNAKDRTKFIKSIEKIVRHSLEYEDLIKYLKDNMDMNSCEFFHNIHNYKVSKIQVHHEPFDLYSICDIVATRYEKENHFLDDLMIAENVMGLHYSGLIGLIPLSITVHQLVGDGKIVIPLDCVYGKFSEFVRMYYEEAKDYLNILKAKMEYTKKFSEEDLNILNVQYVYTEVDGFYLPQKIQDPSTELKKCD